MAPDWELEPGQTIKRVDLHDRYGGSRQGGIGPSRSTPNVFVFTDPATGHKHGYLDEWLDGALHYFGEGQRGDQKMERGNLAILNHAATGKALRVFEGSSGTVTYLDQFELDDAEPTYRAESTDGKDELRQAIVFRLRPLSIEPPPSGQNSPRSLTDQPARTSRSSSS